MKARKIIFLLYMMLGLNAVASADGVKTAPEINISTEKYIPNPSSFDFAEGRYEYDVSWSGITAASAGLDIEHMEDSYKAVASARTYSGIDLLYKLRYRAESEVTESLTPVRTVINQTENSKVKTTEISFNPGRIHSVRTTKGKPSEIETFDSKNFTLDPFSAALLARGLDWSKGVTRSFDTYNGKTRYLITLTCEDVTSMKVNGEERKVWVIVPSVRNLNDETKNKKLRRAEIFVTADSQRELLQIKSEVFIGSVSIKLRSFTPKVSSVQMASLPKIEWTF